MRVGFAGRVAHAFLDSKLTPLVIACSAAARLCGQGARTTSAKPATTSAAAA